jgi:glutathione S-transferase
MLELWQTEWCPASRRVRQRLTELGLDYVAHQVPAEKSDRSDLLRATGSDTIPVLVLDSGLAVVGEEEIFRYLDERMTEPADAEAHKRKAALARLR